MRYRRTWLLSAVLLGALACSPAGGGGAPAGPQGSAGSGAGSGSTAAAPPAGTTGESPASQSSAPPPLRKVPMALSALSATMTPVWVAADYGIFQRYGIELEFNQLSPAAASQALSGGSVPIAVTGGSSISAWLSGASDRVFIAGLIDKALLKVITNTPDVRTIQDVRGRQIATTTPGSGGSMALFAALRRFGIEPNRDVEVTYLRDQPTVLSATLTGNTAAGSLPSPFSDQGLADGARLLADMNEMGIRVALNHITTTRGEIERDRDFLRRLLMGYIEGIQYARDNPDAAIDSIMRGTRQEQRQEAELAYNLARDVWSPWPSEEGIQLVFDNSDLPAAKTARPADMLDLSIMRELESSGWLAAHLRQ